MEFYAERVDEPLEYIIHDVNAHDDAALQDLRDEHGYEAYGRFWHLAELLGERVGHYYDIARPNGWRRLAQDLEYGRDDSGVKMCREFIEELVRLGLLSEDAYECGRVRSNRIDRNASKMAEGYANRKFATWIRDRNRR